MVRKIYAMVRRSCPPNHGSEVALGLDVLDDDHYRRRMPWTASDTGGQVC